MKPFLTFSIPCLLIAGCAVTPQEVRNRYFWPPLPGQPRIEFLSAYMSENDLPKTAGKVLLESVAGRETKIMFRKPWGIAADGEGKVYIANSGNSEVVIFDFKKNETSTLNSEGLIMKPVGLAVDGDGNLYVSDSFQNNIYVFNREGKPLRIIGDEATLSRPAGMTIDNRLKRLYVANVQKHNIEVFDLQGEHLFKIGKVGERDGEFNMPSDIDIDSKGNLVVADTMNARVQILNSDGGFISKFGVRGHGLTDFQLIKGIAVDREDRIFVSDSKADKFLIFDKDGEALLVIGTTANIARTKRVTPGGFFIPQDIHIDRKNNLIYIVDSMNARFHVYKIVDDEWLKEHPVRPEEQAPLQKKEEGKNKTTTK